MSNFNEMDKMVLTALGASTNELQSLESMGIFTKQAIAAIGNAETLTAMAGINSSAATNIVAWASIDLESNTEMNTQDAAVAYTPKTTPFKLEALDFYMNLINASQEQDEINVQNVGAVSEIYERLDGEHLDANEVYNFARNLSIMLEPALNKIYSDEIISSSSQEILGVTEAFFKKAIEMFNGFGRARIMYAYMLCMQKRFQETIEIVESALTLPEGGQDWMTAAYWYLTAKAAIGDTYSDASVVYEAFKSNAVAGSREQRYIENTLVHYFE